MGGRGRRERVGESGERMGGRGRRERVLEGWRVQVRG
jgi:hypothetical protein